MDIIYMKTDTISFREIYDKYAKDVYRFSYWLCGNADDAKDITSETFIRIWTSDSEIRSVTVKAYLCTVARNVYLHQKQKSFRFTRFSEEIHDTAVHIDHELEVRSELEHTLSAMQFLPEIDRTMLIMQCQEDISYDDIATATGYSLSAVKVKIFRARAKLAKLTTHT